MIAPYSKSTYGIPFFHEINSFDQVSSLIVVKMNLRCIMIIVQTLVDLSDDKQIEIVFIRCTLNWLNNNMLG